MDRWRTREGVYFAGDFADNPMRDRAIPLAGYITMRRWLESRAFATSKRAFHWRFSAPMVANILNEAAHERAIARAQGRLSAHQPRDPEGRPTSTTNR